MADLPKGRELVSESVANPIAGSLASLTLDEVHPRPSAEPAERGRGSQGRKAPSPSRATFRTFDGLTIEVTGRVDGDRRLVSLTAKSDAEETKSEAERLEARLQPWEFEIPTWKYDAIFRPLDELLK